MMTAPSNELFRLLLHFQQHNVRYLVIGGMAVNRYGFHRTTGDVDIYLEDSTANRRALIEALQGAGYGRFELLMTAPILAGYCEIMMDDGLYADLTTAIPGLDSSAFDQYYSEALEEQVEGVSIRYISYRHLIQNKRATGRPKDLLYVDELELSRDNPTE